MKKVFVVGDSIDYANFIEDCELVSNIDEADIVLFTGGEDVCPRLYDAKPHHTSNYRLSRDLEEQAVFNKIKPSQLALGICRGSQFLCVMNGGKLVQDCANHALYETHSITDGNKEYEITSTHHQMQYPYNLDPGDYTLLFTASPARSHYYDGEFIINRYISVNGEPEIVLYHKKGMPKCLAIQGHPEYMRHDAPVVKMLNELINQTLNLTKDND